MSTAQAILACLKRQHECEAAVATLRKRTQRNIPYAMVSLALALWYLWDFAHRDLTHQLNGSTVLTFDGLMHLAVGLFWLTCGVRYVWVSASDRLLLLLAEEALTHHATTTAAASSPSSETTAAALDGVTAETR